MGSRCYRRTGGVCRSLGSVGRLLAASLFLILLASPGVAQVGAERLGDVFPPEALGRIHAIMDRAERDGIPPRLVMDKALEGAAKGATPEQVLEALSVYVRELRASRQLVGAQVRPDVLVAATEALRRGAARDDVRTLGRHRQIDPAISLVVLGDLTEEGVPSGSARRLIEEASVAGWRGDRLLFLPAEVRRLVRAGTGPEQAAEAVRRDLRDGGGR